MSTENIHHTEAIRLERQDSLAVLAHKLIEYIGNNYDNPSIRSPLIVEEDNRIFLEIGKSKEELKDLDKKIDAEFSEIEKVHLLFRGDGSTTFSIRLFI